MGWAEFESEYNDLAYDVSNAGSQSYHIRLRDYFDFLDNEAISRGLIASLLDTGFVHGIEASRVLVNDSYGVNWARDRRLRLGQQLALFRHFAEGGDYFNFAISYLGVSRRDDAVHSLNSNLFIPFSRELLKLLKKSASLSSEGIPAADRIVQVDHNSEPYKALTADLETIERAVQESNAVASGEPEQRERVLAELGAGRRLLRALLVRANVVLALLGGALAWLAAKFAEQAVAPVIQRALEWLMRLFGA